ncbi:MAG TPA: YncE family protein [Thermoplasmata archaeon]|nr:YncE family protein [Thermoplasmata archaeon]
MTAVRLAPGPRSTRLHRSVAQGVALAMVATFLLGGPTLGVALGPVPLSPSAAPTGAVPPSAAPTAHASAAVRAGTHALSPARASPHPELTTGGTILMRNGSVVPGNPEPWNIAVPLGIAYDPTNRSVWVTGAYSASLGLLDPDTAQLWAGSPLGTQVAYPTGFGGGATAVVVVPNLGELYVAAPSAPSIVVSSNLTGSPVATIPLPYQSLPVALAYDAVHSLVFVADQRLDKVWFVNVTSQSITGNVSVGFQPDALLLDSTTGDLYVANYASSNVSVVNVTGLSVRTWLRVGTGPTDLAQVGSSIWVLNQASGNVSFLNDQTRTVTGSVTLPSGAGGAANSLVVDLPRNWVYVLNDPAGSVAVVNASTGASVATVSVGGTPYRGVYDGLRHEIEFTNTGRNTLDVVNDGSNALVHSNVLGAAPMASFYDATTQLVYVADASVSSLKELDARTNALVGSIPLPAPGVDLAFSPSANELAVVLGNTAGVAFINPGSGQVAGTWKLTNGTVLLHAVYGNGEFFFTGGLPFSIAPFHDVFVVGASGFSELNCVGDGTNNSGITYDSVNHYVYVASGVHLLVISSFSDDKVGYYTIPGAFGVDGAAYSPRSNAVVLSDAIVGDLFVYNVSLSAFDTSVGLSLAAPGEVSYVPDSNTFYIPQTAGAAVETLVDHGGSSYTTGVVTVGIGPASALGYSQLSGLLYVTNPVSGTVSLIQVGSSSSLPMVVSLTVTPTTVAFGAAIHVSSIATYPMWNDSFSYTGLPTGCPSRNASAFTCTPSVTGSFQATVSAQNPFGATASTSARFAVFAPLTVVGFQAQPTVFTLGISTQITLDLSGGVLPLTVAYPLRPTGCGATNSTNWTCKPTASGNFTLEASVSDAGGHSITANVSLLVNPKLTITSFAPSVTSTGTGKPVTFTVTIAGGTAPFSYSYTGLPPGCVALNLSIVPCDPTAGGVYPVLVKVTDSDGISAQANTSLVVSSPPSQSSGIGLSTTDLLIIVAIVVIVVVAAVVVLASRRRGGGGAAGPTTARPAPPSAPEEEAPAEEEGVTIVEAPPPEPILPPSAPPVGVRPERPPPPSRFFSDPNAPTAPAARPAPPPGQARPALICSNCGTANEPWLNVCRKCKRALMSTGTS